MAMVSVIKLSYHKRLFMMVLLFSWAIILCSIGFQYMREKQYKSEFLNAQLQLYNRHLMEIVEQGLSYEDYIESHEKPFEELRITLITLSGAVVYDNMIPVDLLDNHLGRPEVADAMKRGSGYNIGRYSVSDGREYFYSATRGERVVIRTAIPYSSTLKDLLKADRTFIVVMMVISVVISVLAYFATRRLGKNIERLNLFAARVESGRAMDDEEPFPNDELGSISNHIVRLYAQLEQTVQDRDRAHEEALHEQQEKIRIKHQLTDNINHELKTPVAAIQICLETILSDIDISPAKRRELIERCYANNERLRRLLDDVSLLTRMEDGSRLIGRESVDMNAILEEIREEFDMIPEHEHMNLNVSFMERVVIKGNMSLVCSIFRNLIDNAVAYSEGKNINITLVERLESGCHICFEDDGRGVSEDQLPHLFERFYRVDVGRSRRKGGTGLGLAIVKHAVLFHGGTISVCNRAGGGLRFDMTLFDSPGA